MEGTEVNEESECTASASAGGGKKPRKSSKPSRPTYYCAGKSHRYIDSLCRRGLDFTVTATSTTVKVATPEEVSVFSDIGRMRFEEINLRKRFKRHVTSMIEKFNLPTEIPKPSDDDYFLVNPSVRNMSEYTTIEPCVCYDINMAYYQCAKNMGYMSEEMYNECVALPKAQRLRLIGSIATQRRTYSYKDGKLTCAPVVESDHKLRGAWFNIIRKVRDVMADVVASTGDDFIFYWVDGVYLRGTNEKHAEAVQAVGDRHGFSFKIEPINKIDVENKWTGEKRILVYKKSMENRFDRHTGELKDHKVFNIESHTSLYDRLLMSFDKRGGV